MVCGRPNYNQGSGFYGQQQPGNVGAGGWYGAGQDIQYYQQGAARSGQYGVNSQPATGRMVTASANQTPVSSSAVVKEAGTVEVVDSDSVN